MTVEIKNDLLKVSIAAKGAELQSIESIATGIEYLWNGDEKYWGKKSPVLFPIVGGLKNNTYKHNGKNYSLGRHGFARDRLFAIAKQSMDSVTFQLQSDEESLLVYPFHFLFSITYSLFQNKLYCTYNIVNTDKEEMYCSVGAHPAFKLPLTEGTSFSEWYLHFNKTENTARWPLSAEGQIALHPENLLIDTQTLPLTKNLFAGDALVFKNLLSNIISIRSHQSPHGLSMQFEGFPYFGIWSTKGADFVCLEPWCGIADSINASGELKEKEGINRLLPGEVFEKKWGVEMF